MKYYYAFVEGRNFILNLNNEYERVGFVTTFYFSSEADNDIVATLEELLRHRIESDANNNLIKDKYFESFVTINILVESTEKEVCENNIGGFGFYNMSILNSLGAYLYNKFFIYFSNKIKLKV